MKICKDCGYSGKAKKKVKGALGNELALWLLGFLFLLIFFPIGLVILTVAIIYSLWRMFAPCDKACPECGHKDTMVPIDSPIGKKLASEFKKEEPAEEPQEQEEVETENTRQNKFEFFDRM